MHHCICLYALQLVIRGSSKYFPATVYMYTLHILRAGSMVVSHSCMGIISPKPFASTKVMSKKSGGIIVMSIGDFESLDVQSGLVESRRQRFHVLVELHLRVEVLLVLLRATLRRNLPIHTYIHSCICTYIHSLQVYIHTRRMHP